MIIHYKGRNIEELDRDELLELVRCLAGLQKEYEDAARDIDKLHKKMCLTQVSAEVV